MMEWFFWGKYKLLWCKIFYEIFDVFQKKNIGFLKILHFVAYVDFKVYLILSLSLIISLSPVDDSQTKNIFFH